MGDGGVHRGYAGVGDEEFPGPWEVGTCADKDEEEEEDKVEKLLIPPTNHLFCFFESSQRC